MVYYRKYRPQKVSELDNVVVRTSLQAIFAIKGGQVISEKASLSSSLEPSIPHAFLFTGPKGLGKTSSARIVAKVVDCSVERNKRENGFEPCNQCDICVSITDGTNLDVLEIDAASNRGIDEIRDLKEKIRLAPLSAKKKVYIIDEVHMLTTEAFNALLKTLEEPPVHALFILCTTEVHKLPETIISRCFHVAFNHATEEEIVRSLRRVAAGEKLPIQDDTLVAIAAVVRKMQGGFRDATKMLEEAVLVSQGSEITKEWFDRQFPVANMFIQVTGLLRALQVSDMKAALEIVNVLSEQGVDIRFFVSEVLADLHRRLLLVFGVEGGGKMPVDGVSFGIEEIRMWSSVLSKAYQEMRNAVLPQLPLELAIVEVCLGQIPDVKQHVPEASLVRIDESVRVSESGQVKEVSVDSLRKQVGMINKQKALYGEKKNEAVKVQTQDIKVETVNLMDVPGEGEMTKEWLGALWRSIIVEMKQYNHTIAGLLRSCTIHDYTGGNLVITAAYPFHKERLEDMKTKSALISVCKILTGKDVEVTVELKK